MSRRLTIPSRNSINRKHLGIGAAAVLFLLAIILLLRHTPVNAGPPPPNHLTFSSAMTVPFTPTGKLLLSTTLHPDQGRELSNPDDSVRLRFPSGLVSSPRLITLTLGAVGMLPRRFDPIGPAFRLETDKFTESETRQPFTITLHYTPTHTLGNVRIIEWSSQGKWLPLPTQVNTTTQTATALGWRFTAYAVVLQSPGYILPQRAIVVDDMSSGFVQHGTPANWHIAPPPDGTYYAGQAHWTYSSVSAQDNWATWTPPTPLDGDYLVVAFIPSQRASTQHAQYKIYHNGKVDTVEVNQAQNSGDWAILGLFDFTGSTSSYVSLGDVTGEDGWYMAFDAIAFISAEVGPPPGGIVVDDADPGFDPQGPAGYWHIGPPPPAIYYAGQSHWTLNNFSAQENWATWTPPTSLDGNYRVWVFVPSYHSDTRSARYRVYHNGQVDNVEVDQSRYLGDWVSLGVFDFMAATAGYVWLSDVTGEAAGSRNIAFDAVAFTPNNVYLPVVLKNCPPVKSRSGIHLGNRPQNDWNDPQDFLRRLRGTSEGDWPAAVVVLSDQVYNIQRNGPKCTVSGATVKSPWIFSYLTQAAQAGTRVIIRIKPSPGNFQDAVYPSHPHTLIIQPGVTPENNRDYCSDPIPGGDNGKWTAADYYRAIDDIAAEMNAIHALNASYGFTDVGFEPANEPNNEWYSHWYNSNADVKINQPKAWQDMDAYFSALYDYVQTQYPNSGIRILTPPMAQGNFAETKRMVMNLDEQCGPMTVTEGLSGYDLMPNTFGNKNDGYSWHNYWRKGREAWASGEPCPGSHHVFQYFPSWLQTQIASGGKPAFITEADLFSPCQEDGNPVQNKNDQPTETQESLWQFISQERGANYVVAWLLTEFPHFRVPKCNTDLTDYEEIKWHQAYRDDGSERNWFWPWWSRPEP